ncbi:50S ribosomal protein L19 [Candidatus Acetothermia bacterium]|jgi:large subunit ribosomal protein L19|nr:50S ribosomal protein L19 [Candidatus Acetothermia bacterium]MCI2431112.1 50S ribosomal protein L19 [Candidatus Acetothermia bacterium]MCI2437090.1 50S ribosomal protein L19 [Candidatus Acetothermia bacterium]
MREIQELERQFFKTDLPNFRPSDTIRVHERVFEGGDGKERIQIFEGIVTEKRGSGASATFTVRKLSSGIGVDKVFPLHSPRIAKIELVEQGRARRAKLHYLRRRAIKAAGR